MNIRLGRDEDYHYITEQKNCKDDAKHLGVMDGYYKNRILTKM